MADRIAAVKTALPGKDFLLIKLEGDERLGRLFRFDLELAVEVDSDTDEFNLDDILGKPLNVDVEQPDGEYRSFNGLVSEVSYLGKVHGYHNFRLTIRPWLWVLTQCSNNRIFQEKSVPEIIESVFGDHGFTDLKLKLSASYDKREYCVQYGESDFDFVSRLMEEEGIYYFFEHGDNKHELVVIDSSSSHSAVPGKSKLPFRRPGDAAMHEDHIFQWSRCHKVQTQVYKHTSFDYEKPKTDLAAEAKAPKKKHGQAGKENYEYGSLYTESSRGESLAKIRVDELMADYVAIKGIGVARNLTYGCTFTLEDYPLKSENGEYLIVDAHYLVTTNDVEMFGDDQEAKFECEFSAIDKKLQFRPERSTPKSLVRGPQTAIVVGKSGEEIWTDKYGRIKVQFHWDKAGENDENSSCWIRVAQGWAGNAWGMISLPRMGQEVIIDFLEGDPDQPVVTGSVYNDDNKPPFTLPENQTQSGLRTRSTKKGDTKTFNELRFEDKKDNEEIYLHAEKDFKRVVENNDILEVGLLKKDKGNQEITIHNNRTVTLRAKGEEGNDFLTIEKGNQTVKLEKGDQTVKLEKGSQTIDVKKKIDIKAGDQLTITVGQAKLTMKKNGKITISGMDIKIDGKKSVKSKAGLQAEFKGTQTKVEGSAMLDLKAGAMAKLKGGITMIG